MASVRIWSKKTLQLGSLSLPQRRMLGLMSVALGEVVQRVKSATGPTDQPAKPLKPGYQRVKVGRWHKSGVRDLMLTGSMLKSLSVRTVSDNRGTAGVTEAFRGADPYRAARLRRRRMGQAPLGKEQRVTNRIKAWSNMQREAWLVFSPRNQEAIRKVAQAELAAEFQKLPRSA